MASFNGIVSVRHFLLLKGGKIALFPSLLLFEIVGVVSLVVSDGKFVAVKKVEGLVVFVVVILVEIVVLAVGLGVAKEMEANGFFLGCGVATVAVPEASVGTGLLVIENDGGFGVLVLSELPFLALHFLLVEYLIRMELHGKRKCSRSIFLVRIDYVKRSKI